jgi:uncharacterized protein (TIGR03437 family)
MIAMRRFFRLVLLLTPALALDAAAPSTRPALAYSKAFGGGGADIGVVVATDSAGNVYVAGNTNSPDFPVKNAIQAHLGGVPFRASTDTGATWAAAGIAEEVDAVAVSPKAPGVVYAATPDAIYKSLDSGKTWSALSSSPIDALALVADASNASVIYAAGMGISKSTDAGATWKKLSGPPGTVLALVSPAARPTTLFAARYVNSIAPNGLEPGQQVPPSVYRSTDSGGSWTALQGLPDPVFSLACDPMNPDVVYAAANPYGFTGRDTSRSSVYKTTDGGNIWNKMADLSIPASTFALAASPLAVYAATVNGVYRSLDGGNTWAPTTLTAAADNITVDPGNPQIVCASAGGIQVSRDGGLTWKTSLPVRQFVQVLAALPTSPTQIYVGATRASSNIFVSKWTADGSRMIYSTYLGGGYYDYASGIAVDPQGNAYVSGITYGTDFPVTSGALQPKTIATYSGVVAKISPDGGTLLYSTYLSGTGGDAVFGVAADAGGSAYLTGYAGSTDFPVTTGAFQSAIKSNCSNQLVNPPFGDAFVTKLSKDGGSLVYSTLLGGNCGDEGFGITVDDAGNAYVAGVTTSDDFPVTKGAFQTTRQGPAGFIAQLSPQGNAVLAASYIGGYTTTARAVAVGADHALYVTGCTEGFGNNNLANGLLFAIFGSSLPPAGFPQYCGGPAYILKLDPTASSQVYINYLGGPIGEGTHVGVDPAGQAWIAGSENPVGIDPGTPEFPTVHPFQTRMGQGFISEYSADGSTLLFSSRVDSANGMALDPSGNAFLTGFTNPPDRLPVPAVLLARIDGAVPSVISADDVNRITPGSGDPDEGVAPGEILTIRGSGFGPAQQVNAQVGPDGKIGTVLGGVSVTFDGTPAPVLSVREDQITCVVPFEIGQNPDGTTLMQVQAGAGVSNSIRMPAWPSAVEAFAIINQDGSANLADHPASPGSVVTIYAAGLGATKPASVDGAINTASKITWQSGAPLVAVYECSSSSSTDSTSTCGFTPMDTLYAGPAPGQVAGTVQFNVRVPQLSIGAYTVGVGFSNSSNQDYDTVTLNVGK